MTNTQSKILTIAVLVLFGAFISFCHKDTELNEQLSATPIQVSAAAPPCDSLKNVVWGDTLKVVKGTVIPGVVKKGKYKGKKYWFAALYSDALIEPANFVNDPKQHIVVADTTLITNDSKFIIGRIK